MLKAPLLLRELENPLGQSGCGSSPKDVPELGMPRMA